MRSFAMWKASALTRTVRLGLAVLAATAALVVVPASPAVAWDPCPGNPYTPSFYDSKLQTIEGVASTSCNQRYVIVSAEARLLRYLSRTNEWKEVSYGYGQERDSTYAWADVYTSCRGLGAGLQYLTEGRGGAFQGVGGVRWSEPKRSYYREFNCSVDLQEIMPGS